MKYLVITVLVILWISCNQENDNVSKDSNLHTIPNQFILKTDKEISIGNDVVYWRGTPFSGFLYAMDAKGKDTISIEGYLNGQLEGDCKKWYGNNQKAKQLMEERSYLDGKKNGKQIAYWPNGNKRFEFRAVNDGYEGEMKEWSEDGKLFHLANFKNGQEDGVQKLWYENGKIRANYVIINGKRYGLLGTKNCKNVSDSIFIVK